MGDFARRIAPIALGLLVCVSTGPLYARRPTVIPLQTVLGGQVAFTATAGGKQRLFLYDSGGGVTAVSPLFVQEIGCTPWGQITGFRMRGQRLDLKRCDNLRLNAAGLRLVAPTAGIYDILEGAPKDAPPIVGSVGLDMF